MFFWLVKGKITFFVLKNAFGFLHIFSPPFFACIVIKWKDLPESEGLIRNQTREELLFYKTTRSGTIA